MGPWPPAQIRPELFPPFSSILLITLRVDGPCPLRLQSPLFLRFPPLFKPITSSSRVEKQQQSSSHRVRWMGGRNQSGERERERERERRWWCSKSLKSERDEWRTELINTTAAALTQLMPSFSPSSSSHTRPGVVRPSAWLVPDSRNNHNGNKGCIFHPSIQRGDEWLRTAGASRMVVVPINSVISQANSLHTGGEKKKGDRTERNVGVAWQIQRQFDGVIFVWCAYFPFSQFFFLFFFSYCTSRGRWL